MATPDRSEPPASGESVGTDVILQRLKATQISPLTALKGANWRRLAADGRRRVLFRWRAEASEGAELFCARKAPHVRFVSPTFIRANLTRAFEDAMATHRSLHGLYNHTETRGKLLVVVFKKLPLSLSRVLKPKLQSRSKRLSLLTNLAQGFGRGGLDRKKNTYRCSIRSRSLRSWLVFAPAHIVCRATTVAAGNTVHSRFQEPVARRPAECLPNQTMPPPPALPPPTPCTPPDPLLARHVEKLTTINTVSAINFRRRETVEVGDGELLPVLQLHKEVKTCCSARKDYCRTACKGCESHQTDLELSFKDRKSVV